MHVHTCLSVSDSRSSESIRSCAAAASACRLFSLALGAVATAPAQRATHEERCNQIRQRELRARGVAASFYGATFEQASLVRADHELTPIVPTYLARLSVSLLPWSSSSM